jgi:hypothetical protein
MTQVQGYRQAVMSVTETLGIGRKFMKLRSDLFEDFYYRLATDALSSSGQNTFALGCFSFRKVFQI